MGRVSEDIGAQFGRAAEAMRAFARAAGAMPPDPGATVAALVACPEGGEAVAFRQPFTIGQAADCGLRLADEYASAHHALCAPDGDGWTIEDPGSMNGTWLLGSTGPARIRAPRVIAKGDRVKVGHTVITLVPAWVYA